MSDTNAQVLQSFVDAILGGDFAGQLALLHPDCVFSEPEGLPWAGDWVGKDGFVSLAKRVGKEFTMNVEEAEVLDAGRYAVLRLQATFTCRATGRGATIPIVELYETKDGLILRSDIYYKSPGAVAELQSEAIGSPVTSG